MTPLILPTLWGPSHLMPPSLSCRTAIWNFLPKGDGLAWSLVSQKPNSSASFEGLFHPGPREGHQARKLRTVGPIHLPSTSLPELCVIFLNMSLSMLSHQDSPESSGFCRVPPVTMLCTCCAPNLEPVLPGVSTLCQNAHVYCLFLAWRKPWLSRSCPAILGRLMPGCI